MAFTEICFAVLINYYNGLCWDNWACYLNNILLFAYSGAIVVFPFWMTKILYSDRDNIHSERIGRLGYLAGDLEEGNPYSTLNPLVSFLVRIILVLVYIHLHWFPSG